MQLECCFHISDRMLLGYAHSSSQSCPWAPSPGTTGKSSVLHAVVLVMLLQYTQKIGQKTQEMRGLAGKPVLMEKNFRITSCSRSCCQHWGQKQSHSSWTSSRTQTVPLFQIIWKLFLPISCCQRGATGKIQCGAASSYGLQLEGGSVAIGHRGSVQISQLTDVIGHKLLRAQVCFAHSVVSEPQLSTTLQCSRGENLQLFSMAEWWDSTENFW